MLPRLNAMRSMPPTLTGMSDGSDNASENSGYRFLTSRFSEIFNAKAGGIRFTPWPKRVRFFSGWIRPSRQKAHFPSGQQFHSTLPELFAAGDFVEKVGGENGAFDAFEGEMYGKDSLGVAYGIHKKG